MSPAHPFRYPPIALAKQILPEILCPVELHSLRSSALALLLLSALPCLAQAPFPPLAQLTDDGFRVPQPNAKFDFPRDHGSHPDFKIEWWYLTGHLFGPDNERFGYQATFFRRAGSPPEKATEGSEAFRSDEILLFHIALLHERSGKFIHDEKLSRSGWDAQADPKRLSVRVGDSSLSQPDPQKEAFELDAHLRNEARFHLRFAPKKTLVVFGKEGVSRKGDSPTAASWYLTFPRLQTEGTIWFENKPVPVKGETWMDHEISSSQLTGDQAGWDWAGIQLDDGREIMTYRLRKKDGSTDPASALCWVQKDGALRHFSSAEFRWQGAGQWQSPHSKARYPIPVRLTCTDPQTAQPVEFTLEPLANDQELGGGLSGLSYWEGACRVRQNGRTVGSAYVELTGYSQDLSERLK